MLGQHLYLKQVSTSGHAGPAPIAEAGLTSGHAGPAPISEAGFGGDQRDIPAGARATGGCCYGDQRAEIRGTLPSRVL